MLPASAWRSNQMRKHRRLLSALPRPGYPQRPGETSANPLPAPGQWRWLRNNVNIDDCHKAIDIAHAEAMRTGRPMYIADLIAPDDNTGGPCVSPFAFGDDAQIQVWPSGEIKFVCDGCGLGLSLLDRSDSVDHDEQCRVMLGMLDSPQDRHS